MVWDLGLGVWNYGLGLHRAYCEEDCVMNERFLVASIRVNSIIRTPV